ncbi:MAG TPA: alpha-L-arabinofuranosidase [Cyanobacteria bacterium UBA8543]|nr:alpha-L-arabinofuranosidase [Cyanobacteria bacterium UBA8543]
MRRRDILKLSVSGAAIAQILNTSCDRQTFANITGENPGSSDPKPSSTNSLTAKVKVDWATTVAQTTPFTFGSNDYEITRPEAAADQVYQSRLAKLGIGLIRIHYAGLSDRWADQATKTWDEAKIKAGYDASYPQKPTIIQNIPGWPKWMARNQEGLLDPKEYDRYASFCAALVEILNRRQQRKIVYWEPLNEQDVAYQKAGKLDELWKIYNKTATAMKAKDPQIKVGGPALTWDEPRRLAAFLEACRANVDFITWHRYGSGDASESTDKLMSYTPKYADQVREFRKVAKQYIPDRNVPLLLGEYNINYNWQSGEKRQHTHVGAVWFASVLKHLADAGIDMATSWHLKDGVFGLIDPENNLRPAATVFAWGLKYLTGQVMRTETDHPFVEAMAVSQANGERSLLLINKSAGSAKLTLQLMAEASKPENLPLFSLDANGVTSATLATATLEQEPLLLKPYSLVLLLFSANSSPVKQF